MKLDIVYTGNKESRTMKEAFSMAVARLGDDPLFVYLDADLMSAIGTKDWAAANPERAYNVGVSEANMAGLAAGLAASGLKPLAHTFGPFASRRCYDQVFLSIAYAGNQVLMVGSDPGVTAAFNGGTHMPFEDMALYRAIPHSTVIDITDSVMLEKILPRLLDLPGLKYVRFGRKETIAIYGPESEFQVGQGAVLRSGNDVVIFACGIMVAEALAAEAMLRTAGISAAVVDMFSVKPLDHKLVRELAAKTGAVVTAENHNVTGGLGSAIADSLAADLPVPLEMVGVAESFGEVGPQDYLQRRFGLTAENIVVKVKKVLTRKAEI